MSKTLKDIPDFKKIMEDVIDNLDIATVPYFKELEGSTRQRIHNKGFDSDHVVIGKKGKRGGRYSPGYEKKKSKISGKHLYPINLQLNGDLSRSFTVGHIFGKPVLEFHPGVIYPSSSKFDGKPASLAAIHEDTYNTDIWRTSDTQLEDAEEVLEKGIKKALKKALN